jgi:hypothetical protein
VQLPNLKPVNYRQCLKGAALVVFIATPGSMLLLPLLAWWAARGKRKAHVDYRALNTGLRFSMNAVRPSV